MPETPTRRSLTKRILMVVGGLLVFALLFMITVRTTVNEISNEIGANRATGLASIPWDRRAMWSSGRSVDHLEFRPMLQKGATQASEPWIARSAELSARTPAFDQAVATLRQVVSKHHGYVEDLRTESHSGYGRGIAAGISVPSPDFDATIADLKSLGHVDGISESGEDSAVKLSASERQLAAAQTNLERLQKLQRERRGELRDAVALEKDIAQANEAVLETQRQHEALFSTVAQAHIRFTLEEDYRAPLELNFSDALLYLRNSLVDGVGAVFSSLSFVLGLLFAFGLPLLFWAALLFVPARIAWRRFRRAATAARAAS